MVDISNKGLSLILVVAIVVSLSGTILTLTRMETIGVASSGRAIWSNTTAAVTNFSINSSLSIYFSQSTVDFGTGNINQSLSSCNLTTNGSPMSPQACQGFTLDTSLLGNLTIQNNGNIWANVSLNISKNASAFISLLDPLVTGASFQYQVLNSSTRPGCRNLTRSTMKEVNSTEVTIGGTSICKGLNFDTNDSIVIPLWLTLPANTPTGTHAVSFVAIGCDDGSC